MNPMSVLLGVVLLAVPAAAARNDPPREPLPRHALARIGTKRVRPTLAIRSLVYSSDGKLLACGSYEDGVVLHDAGSGQRLRHLLRSKNIHEPQAAFSPDGKWVALTQGDAEIALHEASTGKRVRVLTVNDRCCALAFSPDSRLVAAGCSVPVPGRLPDGCVLVWERASGRLLHTFAGHDNPVRAVAFSPDGKRLASGGNDVRVWDLASGRRALGFPRWMRSSHTLVFTSDSRMLIAPGYNAIVWDLTSGQEVKSFGEGEDGEQTPAVALSPDGKLVATAEASGVVRLWDFATESLLAELVGHTGAANAVAFAPDGKRLASGGEDTTVLLWDVAAAIRQESPTGPLTRAELPSLWKDLGAAKAATGHQAVWRLVGAPDLAVPFLRERLQALLTESDTHIGTLIQQLDADEYSRRVQARKELERYGKRAVPSLRAVLARQPSPEVKRHVRALLARHDTGPRLLMVDNTLRAARALHALELIGNAEAVAALRALDAGLPSQIAQEAQAALQRWEQCMAPARKTAPPEHTALDDPLPTGAVARIGTARMRQAGGRQVLAFSPDDRILASGGMDEHIRLWDTATGKLLRVCEGRGAAFRPIAFSPDGKQLARASWDGTLVLWDTATGRNRRELVPRSRDNHLYLGALTFRRDGQGIVCICDEPPSIRSLSLTGMAGPAFKIEEQDGDPRPLLSADGTLAVSVDREDVVHVYDTGHGKEQLRLRPKNTVVGMAFSPDGRYLALRAGDGHLQVWELATGGLVLSLADQRSHAFAFAPDGRTLVSSGGRTGPARVWDLGTGKQLRRLDAVAHYLAFSHDGKLLATAREDGTLQILNYASGKGKFPFARIPSAMKPLGFLPDGKRLVVGWDDGLALWEIGKPTEPGAAPVLREARRLSTEHRPRLLSPDGKLVLVGEGHEKHCLWNLETGDERFNLREHYLAAVFAPDGKTLATATRDEILLWDTSTGKRKRLFPALKGWEFQLAFSPDGKLLATAAQSESRVRFWETATGKELPALPVPTKERNHNRQLVLAFSPDGRMLAIRDDRGLHLHDREADRFTHRLPIHAAFAFAPDSRTLAGAAADGTIALYDVATGKSRGTLRGHEGAVQALHFSPDGRLLASGGSDHVVLLWRIPGPR